MSKTLPPQASLEHLKSQAKDLLALAQSGDDAALKAHFPDVQEWALHHAQLAVARDYGFASWPRLKRHVEAPPHADAFLNACAEGRIEEAKGLFREHRSDILLDPLSAAVAGETEALLAHIGHVSGLVKSEDLGPRERPILCEICFSRLVWEPEFESGIVKTVDMLLRMGADPNAFFWAEWGGDRFKSTALYGAAGVLNHPGMTKLLLDAGAETDDGESLYHASEHPSNECLRLLLEAGVSQESKDYCIKRKLDYEDAEGLSLYLKHGTQLNVANSNTALSHAVLRGRSTSILRMLLDAGADPNMPDQDGTRPYPLALRLGHREAARLLLENGASSELMPMEQLLAAAETGDDREIDRILAENPGMIEAEFDAMKNPVAAYSGNRLFALHEFARLGKVAAVRSLLRIGFDVNAPNQWGQTPLHWACIEGWPAVVRVLLDAGADWALKDPTYQGDAVGWLGQGSMHHTGPFRDHQEVARILKAHGTRPTEFGSREVQAILNG